MRNISKYNNSLFSFFLILLLPMVLTGQFYFGRNKIQFDQFDWQVINTPHFHIYYYEGEEEIVRGAVFFAEEAFNDLEQKFNHTLDKPVPLFIYSNHIHFQQTNILPVRIPEGLGGFFEFFKQRVVIPYNGNMFDFRHVIRHELVHVFMHSKINSIAQDHGSSETSIIPLWFIEGLAELWSQGWDSQGELIIRDAILHDYLLPLESYDLLRSGFLLYKEGQSFLRYFEENYGTDRIRTLLETYWQYKSFEEAITDISGKNYNDLTTDWKVRLKQEFAKSLTNEQIIKIGENQLTESGANVYPTVYSDKEKQKYVIYLTNRNGYTDIHTQKLAYGKSKPVIKGERKADLESLHFLQSGIHVNKDGILAFVTKSGRQDVLRLVNLENQNEIGSLSHAELVTIRSPDWSLDGKTIVFSAQNYSGQMDIYLWDVTSNFAVRLTDDIYTDIDPCIGPENSIVFSSDRGRPDIDGGIDLFLLETSSGKITQLTKDRHKNTKPFWFSGEPERIYFLSDRSGTPNVWSLTLDDAYQLEYTLQQVTNYHTGFQDVVPTSGDSLLVSAFQKYNFQIHHIPVQSDTLLKVIEPLPDTSDTQPWTVPETEETVGKERKPYKLKYSIDFAQTAVAYDPIFGFLGGAQMGISDLMGNRYYHFLVANTAQTTSEFLGRFNVAVTMVDLTHRSNHAIGFFHFSNDYYSPYQGFYFERAVGLRTALNYPINVFHRLEFSTSLWQSSKDFYTGKPIKAYLVSNYFSYVHDNSLWLSTGPIDGWRLRFTIGPTFDFQRSQVHNYTGLLDLRYYYRFHPNITFAQRTMLWINDGADIRRFYIGGSWGLRGYRITEIYGRKLILLNQELRFPFAESLMLKFGSHNFGFTPIRGALFFDMGNAWDDKYPGLIGSFGIGLRGLFLGGLVLRLDIGKRTDFQSFDKGLFFQFFFGWDY